MARDAARTTVYYMQILNYEVVKMPL